MLARAQQDAVWDRQQHANRIRSLLREYHPSALKVFPHTADLSCTASRLLLRTAPTPSEAAAVRLFQILREAAMHQPPGVEAAFGTQFAALLGQRDAAGDRHTADQRNFFNSQNELPGQSSKSRPSRSGAPPERKRLFDNALPQDENNIRDTTVMAEAARSMPYTLRPVEPDGETLAELASPRFR